MDGLSYEAYEARPLLREVEEVALDVFSPEEIIDDAYVEVTLPETYDKDGSIIPHGLLDLRMGAFDRYICNVCTETRQKCPGHFGYIRLHTPVYHEYFITKVRDILSCCCFHCGALKIHWQELIAKEKNIKTKAYYTQLRDGALDETTMSRGHLTMIKGFVKNTHFCANCKKTFPVKLTRKGPFLNMENVSKKTQPHIMQTQVQEAKVDDILLPSRAYDILRKITDLDCRRLGLLFRPEWLLISVMRVLPICDRPSIYTSGRHSEDELTRKYMDILRENKKLQDLAPNHPDRLGLELSLQEHVTHFFTSKYVQSQHRSINTKSRRPYQAIKSLDTRLRGKKGRFRQNIMGKRVNFTARTVITGDPNLDNDQIGIPISVAMELTYTERVTEHNVLRLTAMVNNGPHKYPGASKVTKEGKQFDLRYKQYTPTAGYLSIGDEVDRHLQNDDLVVFNRHPSLHKVSLMAHRVVVMPYSTFRMNLSPTAAYNADFDGDEMNIHVPQNEMARAELGVLMHVVHNNVTPQASRPILGIVQEATIGLYLLTADTTVLMRWQALNLTMGLRYIETGKLTSLLAADATAVIHGRQLFSLLLPSDFDWFGSGGVEIVGGQLLRGQLSKKHMGAVINGIIHTIFTEYGAQRAHDFTSDAQRLAVDYVSQRGFSVGIGDCITRSHATAKIAGDIDRTIAQIPSIIQSAIEDVNAMIDLQNVMERAGQEASNNLSVVNNMLVMIQSGSKGSKTNITQMSGTVGQQKLLGRRIDDQFTDRTLPYYSRYDAGCLAKGFVRSAYTQGLTLPEFVFHAMGGREGLIDTAVKSVTGDTHIMLFMADRKCCLHTRIGDYIDTLLQRGAAHVVHVDEANMEVLMLPPKSVYIPTTDAVGHVSWAVMSHVTRHDPGEAFYDIVTESGRRVTVVKSKSLLVWDADSKTFIEKDADLLRLGDALPVTVQIPAPPLLDGPRECKDVIRRTVKDLIDQQGRMRDGDLLLAVDDARLDLFTYYFARLGVFVQRHVDSTLIVPRAYVNVLRHEIGPVASSAAVDSAAASSAAQRSNDVVLDKVVSINIRPTGVTDKVYDVTVPDTLNFMLANGLQVRDTAQCGYVTRKLIKALENVKVAYNGLVLNAPGEVLQFSYGDDGFDPTKLHAVTIRLMDATPDDLRAWADDSATLLKRYTNLQAALQQQFHSREKGQSTWYLPLDVARHVRRFVGLNDAVADEREVYYRIFYDLTGGLRKYPIVQALFMVEARPALFIENNCTAAAYQKCLEEMCAVLMRSQVAPGEAVGNLVAQSIGEPTMQMLLNTFHLAGMGNKTTTTGIPRLLELLNDVKTLKSPSMTIFLNDAYLGDRSKAEEIASRIRWQQLQNVISHYEVLHPMKQAAQQHPWFAIWQEVYADTLEMEWFDDERYSSFYLRYTFQDHARKDALQITDRIMNQFPGTFAVASPIRGASACEILVFMIKPDQQHHDGEYEFMRYLAGNIPALVTYRGIEGIKDVFISPMTRHDGTIEYVLETDGINMTQLYLVDEVDPYRTTCNDPNMILQRFGVEGAARTIYREIDAVLQAASLVNARHVQLLVHHMTHNGAISAINRHGFDRLQNIGVLEKASFEKGDTILCTGALERKRDVLQGISGQIALGKLIKMGTGYFDVRLDVDQLKERKQTNEDEFIPSY